MSAPLMTEVVSILIDQIATTDRLREASAEHVAGLAATIEKNAGEGIGYDGLCDPIKVRPLAELLTDEDDTVIGFMLVSGMHRLEACRLLGRDSIAAIEYDIGAIGARRLEIEENLVRHDLNALDRAVFVAEFREMFEAEYGEVSAGRPDNGSKLEPLWSEAAQERFGIGKTASHRHLRIANGLTLQTQRSLSGTKWADNQSALLELCGVEAERQADVVSLLSCFPGLTMREAIEKEAGAEPPARKDEDEKWFRKSCAIFGAHKRLRRRFFAEALVADFDMLREAAEESGFRVEPIKGWTGK